MKILENNKSKKEIKHIGYRHICPNPDCKSVILVKLSDTYTCLKRDYRTYKCPYCAGYFRFKQDENTKEEWIEEV